MLINGLPMPTNLKPTTPAKPDFQQIIADTPRLLLRDDLCKAVVDPEYTKERPPVYIPRSDYAEAVKHLSDPSIAVPFDVSNMAAFYPAEARHGLLYLPFPFLVPGGRFNAMFGWDTAFAVFAWAHEHPAMMREQVDNQLYQIRVYGKVLNANRTYYISRSQPPLIAAMSLAVYRAAEGRAWRDFDPGGLYADAKAWLAQALADLENYYLYWTTGDRLADGGPLSRYWDDADVPAPEVTKGEDGYFGHVRAHFFAQDNLPAEEQGNRALFYDAKTRDLTPLCYRADRAMRASGFDPTGHWGYGALRCMFHATVCLNALLYRMEGEMGEMLSLLSRPEAEVDVWKKRQSLRKAAMQEYMFNPATGLYEDYDFVRKERNPKPFATAFHALWAGLYDGDAAGARKAADSALKQLETPHGIVTSTQHSGSQWDYPNGWPPLQYFAFAGLQRCGFDDDARRVAGKFINIAKSVFEARGSLFEKYNLRDGNADIKVVHGYNENVAENGTFPWTAAALKMAEDCMEKGKI
jgi:alpha,alpha-trehalase